MPRKPLSTNAMDDASEDFETIYQANQPLIYRFMFWRTKDEFLAQDLTSSVFEKAWRTRMNFKGGSSTAWLYRIARTTLIDYWRKKKDVLISDEETAVVVNDAANLDEALDLDMRIAELETAVARLPRQMEQVVRLRFIEGLSARQVSAKTGISEANVRVMQYRALKKLRGYLQ